MVNVKLLANPLNWLVVAFAIIVLSAILTLVQPFTKGS